MLEVHVPERGVEVQVLSTAPSVGSIEALRFTRLPNGTLVQNLGMHSPADRARASFQRQPHHKLFPRLILAPGPLNLGGNLHLWLRSAVSVRGLWDIAFNISARI